MIITPFLVIAFIIVFVLLFLFFNTVDKRKWLTGLISLVLTPLAYFYLVYPFINIISSYHHQKYFNSEAWLENPALRYELIDNTIESDTLIGLTKSDIEDQLGPYEWLTWDDSKKIHDDNRWNYGLGIEPGAFNDEKDNVEVVFKADTVYMLRTYKELITFEPATNE